jgi:hypothetical protein
MMAPRPNGADPGGMSIEPSRASMLARALAVGLAAAFAVASCGSETLRGADAAAPSASTPSLAQLVGQKLVVSMNGTTPSRSLLRRAHRGRIGGVLIHRHNLSSGAQLRAITSRLQQAAAAGGQPRLLIAVDQEGGAVKTISWIPPTLSPPRMGELGSTTIARRQGGGQAPPGDSSHILAEKLSRPGATVHWGLSLGPKARRSRFPSRPR